MNTRRAPPKCGFGGNLPGEMWSRSRIKPSGRDIQKAKKKGTTGYVHFTTGERVKNVTDITHYLGLDVDICGQQTGAKQVKEITIDHEKLGSVIVQPWQDPGIIIQEFERQEAPSVTSPTVSDGLSAAPLGSSVKRVRELKKTATALYNDGRYDDARNMLSHAILECEQCIEKRKQQPTAPQTTNTHFQEDLDLTDLDITDEQSRESDVAVMLHAALLCQRVSASLRNGNRKDALDDAQAAIRLTPRR